MVLQYSHNRFTISVQLMLPHTTDLTQIINFYFAHKLARQVFFLATIGEGAGSKTDAAVDLGPSESNVEKPAFVFERVVVLRLVFENSGRETQIYMRRQLVLVSGQQNLIGQE